MATKIKGGGARKYDRNRVWCKEYRARQQRERNKAADLARHIRRCPWDLCARASFGALPQAFQKSHPVPPICKSPAALRAETRAVAA